MKNNLFSPFHRFTLMAAIALCAVFSNPIQAQETLCQQIGANFVPNITIGTTSASVTYTSNLLVTGWTNQKIVINGSLVINSNFQIANCSLKMGTNAIIQINPNVNFTSTYSKYFRCGNDLWVGFVATGGVTIMWFNHIEDANIAMDIKSANANVVLAGNLVNRNRFGLTATGITVNAVVAANTFDCTSIINGNILTAGLAGISLTNCPAATIGLTQNASAALRNIFRNQSNGIKLSKTVASIGLSTFNKNGRGVAAGNKSTVTIRGADMGLTTNFSLNREDVYATQSNLNVYYCYLDSCKSNNITSLLNADKQQVHIYDNTINVTLLPDSASAKIGISLDRSKLGNDAIFRNTIERNHIVIQAFGGNSRRAMHIRGSASTHDFMRIDSNFIEVMPGGTTATPCKVVDIDISSADNFIITRNTISSTNTYATGSSRWGFFLVNGATTPAKGNIFSNNSILGIGPDDGCCAMHGEDAGPWSICSNTTDHTYRGFHFIGNCGQSSFGLNTIKNHNVDPLNLYVGGTGLLIQGHGSDNAFLGDQSCQFNYWDLTDYSLPNAYTAIILGKETDGPGQNTIKINEFYVENLGDPHQAPIDRNPMENWFRTIQCLLPSSCIRQDVPNFDENDETVRNNYPVPQASPGVEEWQSTRYVVAKLMQYPALATGNVLVFQNAYSQSSAARFARFDSLMNVISSASAASQANLNNLETSIQNKLAQINALDASISDFTNLEPGLFSSRAVLLSELAAFSDQCDAIRTQNASLNEPLLTACAQFNNALPANQVYEQNQKLLNTLAIQLAEGIELSQTDKDALHTIAQQCYPIAGRTKSAAAALLPPEEGAQYWQENPEGYNCSQQRTAPGVSLQNIGFSLSPNPCTDLLHVQFDAPFDGVLVITDLSGRVVQELFIRDKVQTLDIPVLQWHNGVYILSCANASGKLPSNSKFVVLR